jgi:hypothetical protein
MNGITGKMKGIVMKYIMFFLLVTFLMVPIALAKTVEQCNMTFDALEQYPNFLNIQVNGEEANIFIHPMLWEMMPDDQKVGLMNCTKILNNVQKVVVFENDGHHHHSGLMYGWLIDYMSGNYQIY